MSRIMTWHQWFNNPLDYIGRELYDHFGRSVRIEKHIKFKIYIDDILQFEGDIDRACMFLQQNDVSISRPSAENVWGATENITGRASLGADGRTEEG